MKKIFRISSSNKWAVRFRLAGRGLAAAACNVGLRVASTALDQGGMAAIPGRARSARRLQNARTTDDLHGLASRVMQAPIGHTSRFIAGPQAPAMNPRTLPLPVRQSGLERRTDQGVTARPDEQISLNHGARNPRAGGCILTRRGGSEIPLSLTVARFAPTARTNRKTRAGKFRPDPSFQRSPHAH